MNPINRPSILVGGVGGDAHSVGLTILRHALLLSGYHVHFLGTQNSVGDFFKVAAFYNVIMISTLDGHARYYLRNFPELVQQYRTQTLSTLWYLGGNLQVDNGQDSTRHFLEMGFHRVFAKFTDLRSVLAVLQADLDGVKPKLGTLLQSSNNMPQPPELDLTSMTDEPLPVNKLFHQRHSVLQQWRTGCHAKDINDNAEFLSRQPSFANVQALTRDRHASILIQPRTGVPSPTDQEKIFLALKSIGVPVMSYQVDSLTRVGDYTRAKEAIAESQRTGAATLNGFPMINFGVPILRQIITSVRAPLQTRHSARDPRLLAEISYAGGVTAFEGGCICYNIPYYKDYPLPDSIQTWQYVDRLTALYYERFGIVLDREFFGVLTGTLIPPCIAIVVDILEAILAVQQGVKSISLGYAEQGNRVQDIAAIRTLKQLAGDILNNLGYKDVQINTIFHQYMAAFPEEQRRAEELIYNSAVTAALSSATRMLIKTPVEAYKIPNLADNLLATSLVWRGISAAKQQRVDERSVSQETAIIRREAEAILDSLLFCGGGSVARGIIAGFQRGFIDIPFAPSQYNKGKVITARDANGAIRFVSVGNIQFDRELREFHREKIAERRLLEGNLSEQQSYLLVEQDVLRIPRGDYRRWPLDT